MGTRLHFYSFHNDAEYMTYSLLWFIVLYFISTGMICFQSSYVCARTLSPYYMPKIQCLKYNKISRFSVVTNECTSRHSFRKSDICGICTEISQHDRNGERFLLSFSYFLSFTLDLFTSSVIGLVGSHKNGNNT